MQCVYAGQGNRWAERAVGRGLAMPGAPAAAAARWAKQTSGCRETKHDAAESDHDADGDAAGEWSSGGWRDTGRLINFILFDHIIYIICSVLLYMFKEKIVIEKVLRLKRDEILANVECVSLHLLMCIQFVLSC